MNKVIENGKINAQIKQFTLHANDRGAIIDSENLKEIMKKTDRKDRKSCVLAAFAHNFVRIA